jgi:hypothetical protein
MAGPVGHAEVYRSGGLEITYTSLLLIRTPRCTPTLRSMPFVSAHSPAMPRRAGFSRHRYHGIGCRTGGTSLVYGTGAAARASGRPNAHPRPNANSCRKPSRPEVDAASRGASVYVTLPSSRAGMRIRMPVANTAAKPVRRRATISPTHSGMLPVSDCRTGSRTYTMPAPTNARTGWTGAPPTYAPVVCTCHAVRPVATSTTGGAGHRCRPRAGAPACAVSRRSSSPSACRWAARSGRAARRGQGRHRGVRCSLLPGRGCRRSLPGN